ncbi:MAG TPA: lytic murein transglycosylase [Rhizomicrobium sp.]|nr:lytic murein transglycosylase [Rhizomicrobium sp.]
MALAQPPGPVGVPTPAPNPSAVALTTQQAAQLAAQQDAKFAAFIRDFRDVAIKAGIAPAIYDASMAGIRRNADVEQANLQQPEFVKPIWSYIDGAVSADRVAHGQQMAQLYSGYLSNDEQRYGVPREILVAIWGMESNYGSAMGHYNMFEALATLAYDGPRTEYARKELIDALKMEQQENLSPQAMTSSWAGAFGNTQFVPSAFLAHAVDGDNDGKRDLWHSAPDALASTASLLADAGWERGLPCETEVTLPAGFDYALADGDTARPLAQWRTLGVTRAGGTALAKSEEPGAIYLPAGARGPAFLVFDNFKTVLTYNNAASYALGVCLLADRVAGGGELVAPWPRDEIPLTHDDRIAFQTDLKALGYDIGDIDGILGRKARAALRLYQQAHGLPADGFPTQQVLGQILLEAQRKER